MDKGDLRMIANKCYKKKCLYTVVVVVILLSGCLSDLDNMKHIKPYSSIDFKINGNFVAYLSSDETARIAHINNNRLYISKSIVDTESSSSFKLPGIPTCIKYQYSTPPDPDASTYEMFVYLDLIMIISGNNNESFLSCFANTRSFSNFNSNYNCLFNVKTLSKKIIGCIRDIVTKKYYFITYNDSFIYTYNQYGQCIDKIPMEVNSSFMIKDVEGNLVIYWCHNKNIDKLYVENNKIKKENVCKFDKTDYYIPVRSLSEDVMISTYLPLISNSDLFFLDTDTNFIHNVHSDINNFKYLLENIFISNDILYEYYGNSSIVTRNCKDVLSISRATHMEYFLYKTTDNKLIYYGNSRYSNIDSIKKTLDIDLDENIIYSHIDHFHDEITVLTKNHAIFYKLN